MHSYSKQIKNMKKINSHILGLIVICILPVSNVVVLAPGNPLEQPYTDASEVNGSGAKSIIDTARLRTAPATDPHHEPKSSTWSPAKSDDQILGHTIVSDDGQRFPIRRYKSATTPNDPEYQQPWIDNSGVKATWDIQQRNDNKTLLAIIDTGFALQHDEFNGRWEINSGETGTTTVQASSDLNCTDQGIPLDKACNNIDDDFNGINDDESGATNVQNRSRLNCSDQGLPLDKACNNIDDDGNGFPDDIRGWDFINYDDSSQAGETNPNGGGTRHGTYVTGIAAATGNNGVGIAGVDWNTRILPLQALNDEGYGNSLSVARAIRYASARGADVISLSLGSDLPDEYLRSAISDAIAGGSIVVAAAGNDGCDCMLYPANYPETVAVGASDPDNNPAAFSSWGTNLDVLAPGVNLHTTTWRPENMTSAYASNISGTSLATPIVSGLLTRMRNARPDLSALELVAMVTENSFKEGLTVQVPHNPSRGYGSLRADLALNRLFTPLQQLQIYGFDPVSAGSSLEPLQPLELIPYGRNVQTYDCAADHEPRHGGTALYVLSKADKNSLYTISESERARALVRGYNSRLAAYVCILLPDDSVTFWRHINLHRELTNTEFKY
jgi:hypothetical protein